MSEKTQEMQSRTDDSTAVFECPYCNASYTHEILTRAHISFVDDDSHINRNGFMPETDTIEEVTNGDVIGTHEAKAQITIQSALSTEDIPERHAGRELSQSERLGLYYATLNCQQDYTYTELEQKINSGLEVLGLPTLAYRKVRELLQWFYKIPKQSEKITVQTQQQDMSKNQNQSEASGEQDDKERAEANIERADDTLSDLTPLQQAIILAYAQTEVHGPDMTYKAIAESLDCGTSYPTRLFGEYEDLRDRITSRVAGGESVESVMTSELTEGDLHTMLDDGLFDDFEIDMDEVMRRKMKQEGDIDSGGGATADESSSSGGTATNGSVTGSDARPLSASPESDIPTDTESSESTSSPKDGTSSDVSGTANDSAHGEESTETTADTESQPTSQPSSGTQVQENQTDSTDNTSSSTADETDTEDTVDINPTSQTEQGTDDQQEQAHTGDANGETISPESVESDKQHSDASSAGEDSQQAQSTQQEEQSTDQQRTAGTDSRQPSTDQHKEDATQDVSPEHKQFREDIEEIRRLVQMELKMVQNEAELTEPTAQQVRLTSLLQQMNERLSEALEQGENSR